MSGSGSNHGEEQSDVRYIVVEYGVRTECDRSDIVQELIERKLWQHEKEEARELYRIFKQLSTWHEGDVKLAWSLAVQAACGESVDSSGQDLESMLKRVRATFEWALWVHREVAVYEQAERIESLGHQELADEFNNGTDGTVMLVIEGP